MVRIEVSDDEAKRIKGATGQRTVTGGIRALIDYYQSLELAVERAEIERDTKELIKGIYDKIDEISIKYPIRAHIVGETGVRRLPPTSSSCVFEVNCECESLSDVDELITQLVEIRMALWGVF